ncbi:hypothetical protein KIN20_035450 [Parelaphostrongylus tenuis]|uniref:Uncharacterized protein n=1 Tax=Parelaphostrongylus tenuis TaxID=148309 RepID=A0AAD5WKI9_PARTN|nr:hypothetical protein KIN20_035450 [Parelaphostrongylus tenuis]
MVQEKEEKEVKDQVKETLTESAEELEKANAEANGSDAVQTTDKISEPCEESAAYGESSEVMDNREAVGSEVFSHEAEDAEVDVRNDNEDDSSNFQMAWEVLEVARNICDMQAPTREWELRKADVLFALADCAIEEGKAKQRLLLRIESVEKSLFEVARGENEGKNTEFGKLLADLKGLISDTDLEKKKYELKTVYMAALPKQTTSNDDTPVNDISNIMKGYENLFLLLFQIHCLVVATCGTVVSGAL